MKNVLTYLTIVLFSFSTYTCASKKQNSTPKNPKIKTLKGVGFTVDYPNTWMEFGGMGYVNFAPKELKKQYPSKEGFSTSVNKYFLSVDGFENIEEALYHHGNTKRTPEKTKTFKITKINTHHKFLYKIDYTIIYKSDPETVFKCVEYFFKSKNKIEYIYYQMFEDLYDTYLKEAMVIINSHRLKT
ncbi:hypothetical protein [Winogradskyella sp. Asnod2-B02-A]|uniref:hypothetical protein n=1 Tax=Winogradskyella sp. Asnod2-B02-A TaxID=3160583 RepID=UPI00386E9860